MDRAARPRSRRRIPAHGPCDRQKQKIEIWGDGSVARDYLYVEDLAKLCVVAAVSCDSSTRSTGSSITSICLLIAATKASSSCRWGMISPPLL
ncbi:NAD-dependent epimerase/dehydratase family protein [Aquamicrobium terrae]|uniref:NAD-dependent epimerase/dehydratase family protein n=1 Tax=Aquamicrobium terrae TaxID=1324945 RepID=UPI00339767CC